MENGDTAAVSMYFVVFLMPTILLVLLNGLTLELAKRPKNVLNKRIISLTPVIICLTIAIVGELKIPQLDGKLAFVGGIGTIALGITNIVWNFKLRIN